MEETNIKLAYIRVSKHQTYQSVKHTTAMHIIPHIILIEQVTLLEYQFHVIIQSYTMMHVLVREFYYLCPQDSHECVEYGVYSRVHWQYHNDHPSIHIRLDINSKKRQHSLYRIQNINQMYVEAHGLIKNVNIYQNSLQINYSIWCRRHSELLW